MVYILFVVLSLKVLSSENLGGSKMIPNDRVPLKDVALDTILL
jgi:hypothetical protein